MGIRLAWTLCLVTSLARADTIEPETAKPSLSPAAPSRLSATAIEEARVHYERGIEAYKESAFDTALIELERAYALAPSSKIIYNIALVNLQTNDYAGALRAFETYLSDKDPRISPQRREEVRAEIVRLKMRVATVIVKTNVAGADITVDDVPVGKSPVTDPLLVNAGRRRIAASKEGRIPVTKILMLEGTASAEVTFDLVEPTVLSPSAPPQRAPEPRAEPIRTESTAVPFSPQATHDRHASPIVWAAWGSTALLTTSAIVTGVFALQASQDLVDRRKEIGGDPMAVRNELDSLQSRASNLARVTDILAGTALVAGGISLYLTLHKPSSPATSVTSALPGPVELRFGPGSVVCGGVF